ncbi:MAG TPA: DoxX family protein [Candidatus Paceibacterota bacterium]
MLNPFPELLSLSFVAPLILRVVVGLIFINTGYLKITKEKQRWAIFLNAIRLRPAKELAFALGLIEIAAGAFLIVGLFTQYAVLALLALTAKEWYVEYKEDVLVARDIVFYTIVGAILLSLLLTGAGFLAFDLPL